MTGFRALCTEFPLNYLAAVVHSELGSELIAELEARGSQLVFAENLESYHCTNTTPELDAKIKAIQDEGLRLLFDTST